MRAALLFLFLCLFLLGGNDNTRACLRAGVSCCHHLKPVKELQLPTSVSFSQHRTNISASDTEDAPYYLVCDDAEDDDTDNAFSRKFKTLAAAYPVLLHLSILNNCGNSARVSPSLSARISYKYILQRVLRV